VWYIAGISTTQKAEEIGLRSCSEASPGKSSISYLKNKLKAKALGVCLEWYSGSTMCVGKTWRITERNKESTAKGAHS
jgi:hypothetical protein